MAAERLVDVAAFVRDRRQARGLTLATLAKDAGLSEATVFYIEKGRRNVRWDTVVKVLAALGFNLAVTPAERR